MDIGNQRHKWNSCSRRLAAGLVGFTLTGLPLPARAAETDPWHHLPDNTALVMLLDTTADTWGQLSQYQLFKLLTDEQGIMPYLPGLPYLPYGIDFAAEVAPWVGDTALVALLPVELGAFAPIQNHLVMVAPASDTEALADFQTAVFDLQGDAEDVVNVLGTDIYVWPAPQDDWPEDWPECEAEPEANICDSEADPASSGEQTSETSPASLALRPQFAQSQSLRFSSGLGLPLTIKPLHAHGEDDAVEVEVPMPVPEFGPGGLAIAFLPDALIAAETPAAVEQYLRLRQADGPSLADNQEFQRTQSNQRQSRALFALYGNALELLNYDLSATALPTADLPLPLPLPPISGLDDDTLATLRSLNFGGTLEALVYPQAEGMQFRGRYYYDAVPFTFGLTPTVADADSPLTLLPASTFLMLSGRNMAGIWRRVTNILEVSSDFTREGLTSLRSFFTLATGLDLDQDVFGWMDGEVAIAAFPTDGGPLQYAGIGLLVQTSDRPAAENTLSVLDELVPTFGLDASARTVNQQPAMSWELPFSNDSNDYIPELSLGSHGWVTEDTLAITSGVVPMASLLAPSPHDPLADFFLYDQATAAFPHPNNGYFYLNVGATLALVYQVFDLHNNPGFEVTKPYLGSVRSLSATTALTPNHIEIHGQLGLAPRRD